MIMLAWPSSLQIPTSTIVTADATEGGRLPDCHRVSVHFTNIFIWIKAMVWITAVRESF